MKKYTGLLVGLLLLAGCSRNPTTAPMPADEAAAVALSSGTDVELPRPAGVMYPAAEEAVVAEAVIEPDRWSALSFKAPGEVVEVLVEQGDIVAAGDLLIQLDPADTQMAIEQAQAALRTARARLALQQAGARPEAVAAAEAQLKACQARLGQAAAQRDQLVGGATEAEIAVAQAQVAAALAEQWAARDAHDNTMKCMTITLPIGWKKRICPTLGTYEEQARYGLGAADKTLVAAQAQLNQLLAGADAEQVRAAQADVRAAVARCEAMQARLDLVRAGAAAEEIAVTQATVAEAEAAVAAAGAVMTHTEIRAPFAGTVTEINVKVGNAVRPGQVACVLAELGQLQARTTDLTELDVAQIAVGQLVLVTVDALPGRDFTGVVRRIALQAQDFRGQVVYAVTIELPGITDAPLRWGMTAWVEFKTP